MDSKDNSLIEVKGTFWGKFVNNVKSFFSGVFSRKEKIEEINDSEKRSENFSNIENSLNSIEGETIELSSDIQSYDNTENQKTELSLQEKLEKLIKENQELEVMLNNKFEELKKIRIKELKITLEIYKIEEMYLKNYKEKISV